MHHYSLAIISNTNPQPVTLADAKTWLRIGSVANAADDTSINELVQAARERCEAFTGRSFALTQYRMMLDHFPLMPGQSYGQGSPAMMQPVVDMRWPLDSSAWAIRLPRSPLISIDSIAYVDVNGVTQTLDSSQYIVDADSEPGRVTTIQGGYWPGTRYQPKAVTVTFTAGYANATLLPSMARVAMKELVMHYYENRGDMAAEIPAGVESLLYPLKVWTL